MWFGADRDIFTEKVFQHANNRYVAITDRCAPLVTGWLEFQCPPPDGDFRLSFLQSNYDDTGPAQMEEEFYVAAFLKLAEQRARYQGNDFPMLLTHTPVYGGFITCFLSQSGCCGSHGEILPQIFRLQIAYRGPPSARHGWRRILFRNAVQSCGVVAVLDKRDWHCL